MKALLQLVEAYTVASLNDAVRELERQFPEALWSVGRDSNQVALTFDDGPHERDTPALLAALARHGVTATFSWLGERVERMPELAAAAAAAGHQLMIHGYRHRSFLVERPEALHAMLDRTRELLARYSGRDPATITCVRPPYGHLSRTLARRLLSWGYQPVICSIMPVHWLLPAELSVRQVVRQTEGGSLIVLHETLPGPPVAELTDQILTRLADRGFSYVTVDTLRAERAALGGALG
ncbi:MAG: polysaccharide deacetylase family protein [Oscillochloridaceae bacterium]|nr:polysaccharide deacetylase family protein [Chloroflexaceae bacterium]MDW8389052.1 polysaccharide deacetylase family protein [Oscillochloridaceae bacterium]